MPKTEADAPAQPESQNYKESQYESVKKFGAAVASRFTIVPALLLEKQRELKITAIELAVLLQLMSYWWRAKDLPWPSKAHLAERLNMDESSIRRHITSLCSKGIIKRIERTDKATNRQTSNKYSFLPLTKRLKKFAEQAQKQSQEERKAARKPRRI